MAQSPVVQRKHCFNLGLIKQSSHLNQPYIAKDHTKKKSSKNDLFNGLTNFAFWLV